MPTPPFPRYSLLVCVWFVRSYAQISMCHYLHVRGGCCFARKACPRAVNWSHVEPGPDVTQEPVQPASVVHTTCHALQQIPNAPLCQSQSRIKGGPTHRAWSCAQSPETNRTSFFHMHAHYVDSQVDLPEKLSTVHYGPERVVYS